MDETLAPLSERLNDLYYSARDLATELADRLDAYGFDPGELDMIESRLDTKNCWPGGKPPRRSWKTSSPPARRLPN